MQNYIKSMDFPCQFLYYKPKAIVPEHTHAYSGFTNCRIFTQQHLFLISMTHTSMNPFNVLLLKPPLFSN